MSSLIDLKDAVITVYARALDERDPRSNLLFHLGDLAKASLLNFTQAYVIFEKTIGNDADLYAHWLNVNLQVMTLLNGDFSLLDKNAKAVIETLRGFPGGNYSDIFTLVDSKDGFKPEMSRSYKMALAWRVFLDDIELPPDLPVVPPKRDPVAKREVKQ